MPPPLAAAAAVAGGAAIPVPPNGAVELRTPPKGAEAVGATDAGPKRLPPAVPNAG